MKAGESRLFDLSIECVKKQLVDESLPLQTRLLFEAILKVETNPLAPVLNLGASMTDSIRAIYFLMYPQINPAPHLFQSLSFSDGEIPRFSAFLEMLYERFALRCTTKTDDMYKFHPWLVELDRLIESTSFMDSLDLSAMAGSTSIFLPRQIELCYSKQCDSLFVVLEDQSHVSLQDCVEQCDETTRIYLKIVLSVVQDSELLVASLLDEGKESDEVMLNLQLLDHFSIWNPALCLQAFKGTSAVLAELLCKLKMKVYAQGSGLRFLQMYVRFCLAEESERLSLYQWLLMCEVFRFTGCEKLERDIFEYISKSNSGIPLPAMVSLYSHLLYKEGQNHFLTQWFGTQICSEGRRPQTRKRAATSQIRVGIVSSDLRAHAVANFVEPIFLNTEISKHVFFNGEADQYTNALIAMSDEWVDTKKHSAQQLSKELNQKNLDLIVDLGGIVPNSAFKCLHDVRIPIIGYIGGPGSNASTYQDFFIIDKTIDKNVVQEQFTEQLLELPTPWMRYRPLLPLPAASSKIPADPVIGVINDPRKIGEKSLSLIRQILDLDPEIKILFRHVYLNEPYAHVIRRKLALPRHKRHRVIFDNTFKPWIEHMEVYNSVWMTLDPCDHYGGGTSTCDSLFMGCPCVYVDGDTYSRRMTKSFNVGAGLSSFNLSRDATAEGIVDLLDSAKALRQSHVSEYIRYESRLGDTLGAVKEIHKLFEKVLD